MAQYQPQPMDFSSLAELGTIPQRLRERELRDKFASGAFKNPDGSINYDALMQAYGEADPSMAAKMATAGGYGGASVYGTPIWGRDENGVEGIGVIGKDGRFQRLDTKGFQPERGVTMEDLGYGVAPHSKGSGAPVGRPSLKSGNPPSGYIPPGLDPYGTAPPTNTGEVPVNKVQTVPVAPPTGSYMPGTEEARKETEAYEKRGRREEGAALSKGVVSMDIERARKQIASKPFLPNTGFVGGLTQNIPGTPAHDLQGILSPIRSNLGFDKLQAVRDASPTGGALGPVSDFENRLLQSVLGDIEQSRNSEQLDFNLRRLDFIYNKVIHQGVREGEDPFSGFDAEGDGKTDRAADPLGMR